MSCVSRLPFIFPTLVISIGFATVAYAQSNSPYTPPSPCLIQVVGPNPPGTNNSLAALTAASASNIWAVGTAASGSASSTLISHWDGTLWTQVVSPNPGTRNVLNSVSAVSATEAWATGSTDNTTLLLHFQAGVWTVAPSPNPGAQSSQLHAVAGAAANDVWAVGEYSNVGSTHLLLLHWDGSAWSQIAGPPVGGNSILYGVSAQTSSNAWAVGTSWVGSTYSTVLLHWNGNTWSHISSPSPGDTGFLYAVTALSSNDAWAVGSTGIQTLSLHWDGSTWSQVTSPNPGSNGNVLNSASGTGSSDVWAVGEMDTASGIQTLVLHWDGSNWSQVASPNPGSGGNILYGVAAVSTSDIWAVGLLASGSTDNTLILHSCTLPTMTPTATPNSGATQTAIAATMTASASQTVGAGTATASAATATAVRATQTVLAGTATATADRPTQTAVAPTQTAIAATQTAIAATQTISAQGSPTPVPTEPLCPSHFTDVHASDYFYIPVLYLACHNVISGYADGSFRPYNTTTRAQMVKIVVLGEQLPIYTPPAGTYTFSDVQPNHPFFTYIETAAHSVIVNGYNCGQAGEPCDSDHRPYFRPYANVTRGQLSKIVVISAGWQLRNPPVPGTFADVLPGSTFYVFIETAVCHAIISGYTCGGPDEPCNPGGQPYFRPYNDATRGQIAKLAFLALTLGQSCSESLAP